MQIGQGRAGFYSDSRWWDACVERYYRLLARERGEPAERYEKFDERIVPVWQHLAKGDAIADGPAGKSCYIVKELEPQRSSRIRICRTWCRRRCAPESPASSATAFS